MSRNLELELLLKLNDQMSRGLKSAIQSAQKEAKGLGQSVDGIAAATNRVKTSPIERMTAALRTMRGAARDTYGALQKIAQAGVAAAAGGYVLKKAAERPMAYDRQLAIMSNTAYSDRDVAGRIAGKAEMDKKIRSAVTAGGTPEQAAETLNTLVGSGAFGSGQAGMNASLDLLPVLQKYAAQTGADPNALAQIAIAAKQSMGLSIAQIPLALSKAIVAGQEGGFELKDMARWMPQQMALLGLNGGKGMGGFETLLAYNQVAKINAGTADEAGNNLVNLLAKINSKDTANDFKKLNVDLAGSLAKARGNGVNPLDAFVALVGKVGARDQQYLELQAKAEKSAGPEQKATFEAMADILMAKGIGETVQDRQALSALIAGIMQREKLNDVRAKVHAEQGAEGEKGHAVVSATLDYKAEQLGNKKAFAAMDALGAVEGPLGILLDGMNQLAEAHPALATAAYSAATALGAVAASAGVSGIFNVLKGGGGGVVAKAAGSLSGGLFGLLKVVRAITIPGLALAAAWEGGGAIINAAQGKDSSNFFSKMIEGTEFADRLGGTIATILARFGNKEAERALEINLSIDGQQVAAAVNQHNARTARRN